MASCGTRHVPAALVGAAAATLVAVLVWPSGEPPSAEPRPPATTTSTTTTTLPPLDVDPFRTDVATATIPVVAVFAEPPPEATLDARATDAGVRLAAMLPATSPERAGSPAIPTLDAPVRGRRATPTGWEFDNPTSFGSPLTFVVTEDHGEWLRVEMPIRPNGTDGWIRAADVSRSVIDTHVDIDLGDRMLRAYAGDTLLVESPVVVGTDRTPTPTGRLYVTDFDEKYRGSAYGPWILALSGYSQAMDSFSGGVPVIAMHGTNRPELVGQARSNGCIRMPDDVIEQLRDRLPLGTPVDIHE